jgi:hypothetical protein
MSDAFDRSEYPSMAFTDDERRLILRTVARWADSRRNDEPLIGFVGGAEITAQRLQRALSDGLERRLPPDYGRSGRIRYSDEFLRHYVLNLVAAYSRGRELSSVLAEFSTDDNPEPGPAATAGG